MKLKTTPKVKPRVKLKAETPAAKSDFKIRLQEAIEDFSDRFYEIFNEPELSLKEEHQLADMASTLHRISDHPLFRETKKSQKEKTSREVDGLLSAVDWAQIAEGWRLTVNSYAPSEEFFRTKDGFGRSVRRLTIGDVVQSSGGNWRVKFHNPFEDNPDVWKERAEWMEGRFYERTQEAADDLVANFILLMSSELSLRREVAYSHEWAINEGLKHKSVPKFASKKLADMTESEADRFAHWCNDLYCENNMSPELISILTGGVHSARKIDELVQAVFNA